MSTNILKQAENKLREICEYCINEGIYNPQEMVR